jgi:hypothetical protein
VRSGGEHGGEQKMVSADELYPNHGDWPRYLITVFDVRDDGALACYWSERAAWQEFADVEALDEHHYVLIVRPDLAREMAA